MNLPASTVRQVAIHRGYIQALTAPFRTSVGVNYCDLDIGGTVIDVGYTTRLDGDVKDIVSATVDGADVMGLAFQLELHEKVQDLLAMREYAAPAARRMA
jgi:hypothetical protein